MERRVIRWERRPTCRKERDYYKEAARDSERIDQKIGIGLGRTSDLCSLESECAHLGDRAQTVPPPGPLASLPDSVA
jgi:hypothetical protein